MGKIIMSILVYILLMVILILRHAAPEIFAIMLVAFYMGELLQIGIQEKRNKKEE